MSRLYRMLIYFLTLIASLGFCHQSLAEDWTWDQCASRTQSSNLELRAAQSSLQSSFATESAAWSGFYPQITGTVAASSTTTAGVSSNGVSAGLTATENLFSGFQDEAKVESAKINLDIAKLNLRAAEAKVNADLKSAFASLSYAQELNQLAEKILALRQSNLRLVELRFEGGRENKGSVLLSRAYLAQAKLELIMARQNLLSSRIQIANVMALDSFDNLAVVGRPQSFSPEIISDLERLDSLQLQTVATSTAEVRIAANQERLSRSALKTSRAGFWPTLSVSANTTNTGTSWFPGTNQWSVGTTLSYSFLSGGKDYFGTQAAKENLQASIFNQANIEKQMFLKAKQTLTSLLEALQRTQVDQAFSEALALRVKIAREKYNNGILSFDAWDLIENDSITRQKSLLQSTRDQILAEAKWELVQGKGFTK